MDYASEVLSSAKQWGIGKSSPNKPATSSDRKSCLLSARSVKCLVLGGLAASYGCSLGGMGSSAGKTAEVAKVSNLPLSDVGLVPLGETSRFEDYDLLLSDIGDATPTSSCMQGIVCGGIGSLLVQNPLPLLVGLSGCVTGVSAQQRIGNEFQVNTYTNNTQEYPSAASFTNGNFVVTWNSDGQDGSNLGIYGQLFDGNANRIGSEFHINTYADNDQSYPSVASFSNGNFIVTWNSDGQDGSGWGVYGQLFYENTTKLGNEFQANTYTTSDQRYPSVTSFSNSNFVVTWYGRGIGNSYGIHGQSFYENTTKFGNEFQINTYTSGAQKAPSVSSFSNGNFVVVWESNGQDGSSWGVYGQLFYENTTKLGNEFQVNTYTADDQDHHSAASFSNDNFVVVWQSDGQDGNGAGVYGQLFYGNGTKLGNEFQINTHTDDYQTNPAVASLSNGNFISTWKSMSQDGSSEGIYGQLFSENANRIGNEFQINTFTSNQQINPDVAGFSNGNFVVSWQSIYQDGSDYGIYGQLFEGPLITSSIISTASGMTTSSSSNLLSSTNNPTTSSTDETTISSVTSSSNMTNLGTFSSDSTRTSSISGISNASSSIRETSTSQSVELYTGRESNTSDAGGANILLILLPIAGGICLITTGVYLFLRRENRIESLPSMELSENETSTFVSKEEIYMNLPKEAEDTEQEQYMNIPRKLDGKSDDDHYQNISKEVWDTAGQEQYMNIPRKLDGKSDDDHSEQIST